MKPQRKARLVKRQNVKRKHPIAYKRVIKRMGREFR